VGSIVFSPLKNSHLQQLPNRLSKKIYRHRRLFLISYRTTPPAPHSSSTSLLLPPSLLHERVAASLPTSFTSVPPSISSSSLPWPPHWALTAGLLIEPSTGTRRRQSPPRSITPSPVSLTPLCGRSTLTPVLNGATSLKKIWGGERTQRCCSAPVFCEEVYSSKSK
jgi:hypothetical protein